MPTKLCNSTEDLTDALAVVAVNSSYRASRALSKWFKRGVRLSAEGFHSVPIRDLAREMGVSDEPAVAVQLPLTGDLSGDIVLIIPERVALLLVDRLIGAEPGTSDQFGEMEQSCLQETGNIVATSFANCLASWLKLKVAPGVPVFAHDLGCALLDALLVEQARLSDQVLVSKTEFEMEGCQLDWKLLLLPSDSSLALMTDRCRNESLRRNALHTIAVNGAFNASREMSKWLRQGVRLQTEGFERVPLRDVVANADHENPVVALHMRLTDQLRGHTLLMLPFDTALQIVDILMQREPGTTRELDEMGRSCLQETGNIIGSAFVNSWAKWLDITTKPGPPVLRIDLPQAVLESILIEQATVSDEVLMARSVFSIAGQNLECVFYLLPNPSSLRMIEALCS